MDQVGYKYRSELLRSQFDGLDDQLRDIKTTAESDLLQFALRPSPSTRLAEALEVLNASVETDRDVFSWYQFVSSIENRALSYARKWYTFMIMGPSGTMSYEVYKYADAIHNQLSILSPLVDYLLEKSLNARTRETVRVLEEWYGSVIVSAAFMQADLASVVPEEDLQNQVYGKSFTQLILSRLEAVNQEIIILLNELAMQADHWLDHLINVRLLPGLQFLDDVSQQVVMLPTHLQNKFDVPLAYESVANEIQIGLGDFKRFNQLLIHKVKRLEHYLMLKYRYWNLLKNIDTINTDDLFVKRDFSQAYINYWTNIQETEVDQFKSSHTLLETSVDSHPQYLLQSGGTLIGDLALATGATIDGLRPGSHAHNGLDGSEPISGEDIEFNTLPISTVNVGTALDSPINLTLIDNALYTVGNTSYAAAKLDWETTDPTVLYEFQIVELD